MLFGDRHDFAIEAEIDCFIDGFILGHFRMWAHDEPIGDFEGTVALQGCVNWLVDFLRYSGQRALPGHDAKSSSEILDTILSAASHCPAATDWRDRYLLNDVGMTAFDAIDVILVERSDDFERLIWRQRGNVQTHEVLLEPRKFERAAGPCLEWIRGTDEWRRYQEQHG